MSGYLVAHAMDGTTDASPDQPAVIVYDAEGQVARQAIVWFDDAERTEVDDASIGKSGKLVVAGGTISHTGAVANYIAEIGDNNRIARAIRTTPFLPVYVCMADDDTVWSYGVDRDKDGKPVESSVRLRQYSFNKGELRAMLTADQLGKDWTLVSGQYAGEVSLRCASGKVVLFNASTGRLIEADATSGTLKIMRTNPLPPAREMRVTGFAVTDSGRIFASLHERGGGASSRSGLFELQFDNSGMSSWAPVENTVGRYMHGGPVEHLLGADGTNLVFTSDSNGTTHWLKTK